nr:ribonuclease H1-like isoform X1 [Cherax quadricarinatus]
MPFYAVARGHKPGIYKRWSDCQKQVKGYHYARYKKFATLKEAKEFQELGYPKSKVIDRREKLAQEIKTNSVIEIPDNVTEDVTIIYECINVDGRSSPTPQEMKNDLNKLQKDTSKLRSRFDSYLARKPGTDTMLGTQCPPETSFAANSGKRKHDNSIQESDEKTVKKMNTGDCSGYHKTKFSFDSNGFLVVYTDGACNKNGRKGATAGIGVYFGPNHPLNVSKPVRGRATNNTAEIQAATCALELSKTLGFKKVAVHTDSLFMIDCMTSWLKNWKKNNWVKKNGDPVKNKNDLIVLDAASEGLAVKWVHVKGHAGHKGNEMADRLAKRGTRLYKA